MLVRLMYASRAQGSPGADELNAILKKSRATNPALGITGVLCTFSGLYLQVLEGGRPAVNAMYHRIAADPRHRDVELLSFDEVDERRFAHWSMGQVNLARINPALLIKYSETASLDPYRMSAAVAARLLDELVATAAIVGQG